MVSLNVSLQIIFYEIRGGSKSGPVSRILTRKDVSLKLNVESVCDMCEDYNGVWELDVCHECEQIGRFEQTEMRMCGV